MLKAERHKYIMTKLIEEQKVVTTDLALALDLSEDTIRRDLNELDRKKLLKKVYGGAITVNEKAVDVFNIDINAEDQKIQIATKALSLLHDGQVIIMSGGSTNLVFAKLIPYIQPANSNAVVAASKYRSNFYRWKNAEKCNGDHRYGCNSGGL